jgi:hypothetical protein
MVIIIAKWVMKKARYRNTKLLKTYRYLFKKKNAIKISCFPNKLILTHKNEDLYDKMGNFIID